MYVFQLFDYYGASGMCLLWFCFFEAIVVAWVYGAERFGKNIKEMIGFEINPWFPFCWKYLTPLVTFGIFSFSIISYKPIRYNNVYDYPSWAIAFGWFLALSSMVAIPFYIVYALLTTPGDLNSRLTKLFSPTPSPYVMANELPSQTTSDKNKSYPDIVLTQN